MREFCLLKVQLLEAKLGDYKQKRVEFLEKARQHEKSIQVLRSYQPKSPEVDLPGPSPIHPGGATGRSRVLFPSPTLPMSGFTPSKGEEEEELFGVSPRYRLRYPITSTPANHSL